MRISWNRGLMIGLALVAVGCTQSQSPTDTGLGPTSMATVNGEALPESVVRVYALSALGKNVEQLTTQERQAVIDDLVGISLLVQEAKKEELLESRTVAAQMELNRLQLVARLMATNYLEKNPVTEAELQKIYEESLPQLTPTQYKLRHILLETEAEANGVIEQLRQGKDFVALAKEHSSGPTGPNGGDLGWLSADSTVQPVADAMRVMQVGTYSQPVKTDFGYHVLLLEDTRKQDAPPIDSVRTNLSSALERRKLQEHVQALRDAATVTTEK